MQTWNERAQAILAQGCTTFSKRHTSYGWDGPTHVLSSDGNKVTCDNNKSYYDMGGLGSQLISTSNNYSLPSVLEVVVAEKLHKAVPKMERIKLLKNGSGALECAIRFARAFLPDRKGVLWSGYHGTSNTWISCESPGAGTVHEHSQKFTSDLALRDYLKSKKYKRTFGILCMEPVLLDDTTDREDLIKEIIKLAHGHGMIVVLDEVVTGWRVPDYTYTNHWHLDADIVCLGKGTADGYPIGVCGGRADIMSGDSFISNTCNGEEATLKVMDNVLDLVTPEKLQSFWDLSGIALLKANSQLTRVHLSGINTRWTWKGEKEVIALYWQEMLDEGFICSTSMFPKMSQVPVVLEEFISALGRVDKRIGTCKLRGIPPQPVFKRY